ncbi:MAG TPA: hypothetical protein VMX13_18730 [Sedimentisphaerales bacterium]|nr:hypothetical protein [Sedimentisphaerales bacterium]
MQKEFYQIAGKTDGRKIAEFLSKDDQLLLPLLELICNSEQAVDELIDVAGKAAIEAVLVLSAQQVAGPKQPGKVKRGIGWHGRQEGVVSLSERKLRVEKPRLRKKGKGLAKEVTIPAYEAMIMNSRLGSRILEILMKGILPRRAVFLRAWTRCSRSIGWGCRRLFVGVWVRRMLLSRRTAGFAAEHVESRTGGITGWWFAGSRLHCWIWRTGSSGLWAINSCGCWMPSSKNWQKTMWLTRNQR